MSETVAPTRRKLLVQTLLAAAGATVATVLVVLPAEKGVDLTGFGKATGLTRLAKPQEVAIAPQALPAPAIASSAPGPFREDVIEIKLPAGGDLGSEIERKVWMEKGQSFVYSWTSDGEVYSDFHGETLPEPTMKVMQYRVTDPLQGHAPDKASGAFTAPMAGFHGWYFSNLDIKPVTIRVKLAGYYEMRPYPPR